MNARTVVLTVAVVTVGLQAGTYYAWACGVMPGLAGVDDQTFVSAITKINVAIVNPAFLATFVGAPVACAVAVLVGPERRWPVVALGLAAATVAITVLANIPLNDAIAAGVADPAAARVAFEQSWVRWNIARTVTSTAALIALAIAALRN